MNPVRGLRALALMPFLISLTPIDRTTCQPRPSAKAQSQTKTPIEKASPKCKTTPIAPVPTMEKIIRVAIAAEPTAQKYRVDPALLLAIFLNESQWDPDTVGCAAERGIGQFTPTMVKSLGVQNTHDPRENSEKGAAFLRHLLDKYSKNPNDLDLAIAAWNVGEPEVDTCSFENHFTHFTYHGTKPCVPPDEWHTNGSAGKLTNAPTTYVKNVKNYWITTHKLVAYLDSAEDPAKADATARLRVQLEDAFRQIDERDRKIVSLNSQINDLEEKIDALNGQLHAPSSKEAAMEAQQQYQQASSQSAQLRSQINGLSQSDPTSAGAAEILRDRLESANGDLDNLRKQMAEKDTIIAAQSDTIASQKASIAALQKQIDDLQNSTNPGARSEAQIRTLRDEIAAQNSKIRDLGDPLLKKELENQLSSMSGDLELVCGTFAECMSRGQRAYNANDFGGALGFFRQAGIISPNLTLAWHWVGHASMAAGRDDEAYAAWDRILDLHGSIPLTACEEVGQPRCEGGIINISSATFSRSKGEQKLFEVPLSSVHVLNAANHRSESHITFDISINGVTHVFDFFPMGFNCPWSLSVSCPSGGQETQVKIGEYAARTITRLNGAGKTVSLSALAEAPNTAAPREDACAEAKPYVVQWILPSGTELVRIWPGNATGSRVVIEHLDGAIIRKAAYAPMLISSRLRSSGKKFV